jgi:hypothetical protein
MGIPGALIQHAAQGRDRVQISPPACNGGQPIQVGE